MSTDDWNLSNPLGVLMLWTSKYWGRKSKPALLAQLADKVAELDKAGLLVMEGFMLNATRSEDGQGTQALVKFA